MNAILLFVAMGMIGLNILFSYLELIPFLKAMQKDCSGCLWLMKAPFYTVVHLGKLMPTIIDIGGMIILTSIFSMGSGLIGGVAGLFASNLLSTIIFYHTHIKTKKEPEEVTA